jgi:hypothetical protein
LTVGVAARVGKLPFLPAIAAFPIASKRFMVPGGFTQSELDCL